jgi:hypothetical protein
MNPKDILWNAGFKEQTWTDSDTSPANLGRGVFFHAQTPARRENAEKILRGAGLAVDSSYWPGSGTTRIFDKGH